MLFFNSLFTLIEKYISRITFTLFYINKKMGATPSKKDKKSEKKGKHNRREEEEENTEVPASEPKSKGSTFGHVDESTEKYYTVGSSIGK